MTNTQNSSFAATVLDALSKLDSYYSGVLTAKLTEAEVPEAFDKNIGPLFDIVLEFAPGTISGITLAQTLDRALQVNNLAHHVHIDWDTDLIIYTHAWERYAIGNWTDDPTRESQPRHVKLFGVTKLHYYTVLSSFLHDIANILIDPESTKRG
jgi:hypothetical protein